MVQLLLAYHLHVNKKDFHDRLPVYHAVMQGNLDKVKLLIDNGARLTRTHGEVSQKIVMKWCRQQGVPILNVLLSGNIIPLSNQVDLAIMAIIHLNIQLLKQLLRHQILQKARTEGNQLIIVAAVYGGLKVLRFLLANRFSSTEVDEDNKNALLTAAEGFPDLPEDEFHSHVDYDSDESVFLVLAYHSLALVRKENEYIITIAFLMGMGLDNNYQDNCGCTALHLAAKGGRSEIVRFLLENEAATDELSDISFATNDSGEVRKPKQGSKWSA